MLGVCFSSMNKLRLDAVVVVEGRHDIATLSQFIDATFVATEGSSFPLDVQQLLQTYDQEGRPLIILTDPDVPGEQIRKQLQVLFPRAIHAFVPKELARTSRKVGVEHAHPQTILAALRQAVVLSTPTENTLSYQEFFVLGLVGTPEAATRRLAVFAHYGLGHGSAKTLWKRLNALGLRWSDIQQAMGW